MDSEMLELMREVLEFDLALVTNVDNNPAISPAARGEHAERINVALLKVKQMIEGMNQIPNAKAIGITGCLSELLPQRR